jgi:hypothetical protein
MPSGVVSPGALMETEMTNEAPLKSGKEQVR